MSIHDGCVMCDFGEETILHVLVHCSFAKKCINYIASKAGYVQTQSFVEWSRVVGDQVGKDKFEVIAMICWNIWKARNEVWKSKSTLVSEVLSTSVVFLDQWKIAHNRDSCANLPMAVAGDGARTWVKPQSSQIKINVDAALFEESNCFSFGLVAHDCWGDLIEARTIPHVGRVGWNSRRLWVFARP